MNKIQYKEFCKLKVKKYIAKYKAGKKRKQITFLATDRGMAMIGLIAHGIEMKNVIGLKLKQNGKPA